jgi:hypothetical protein
MGDPLARNVVIPDNAQVHERVGTLDASTVQRVEHGSHPPPRYAPVAMQAAERRVLRNVQVDA